MYHLFFFCDEDPGYAFRLAEGALSLSTYSHIKEGTFDTKGKAEDRINNIGSRWVMYPNATIIKELDDGSNQVVGVYMADGTNYEMTA